MCLFSADNHPDESFFFKLDSSLKRNTAFVKKLVSVAVVFCYVLLCCLYFIIIKLNLFKHDVSFPAVQNVVP